MQELCFYIRDTWLPGLLVSIYSVTVKFRDLATSVNHDNVTEKDVGEKMVIFLGLSDGAILTRLKYILNYST